MSDIEQALRVLVVAGQPMARAGLRGLLAERSDVMVVGQSASPEEAGHLALGLTPDIVLVAWEAGEASSIAALAEELGAEGTPLVLMGEVPTAPELHTVLRAGARGFLLADATGEDLGAALLAVSYGLLVLDPLVGRIVSTAMPTESLDEKTIGEALTDREGEVLQLMALGLPNKTIAQRLRISEHTVKFHVGSILAKLGATSRTEAVTRAVRRGLLTL